MLIDGLTKLFIAANLEIFIKITRVKNKKHFLSLIKREKKTKKHFNHKK